MTAPSPVPTPPPSAAAVARALANTCGWINANAAPSAAVTCDADEICGVLSGAGDADYVNCCTSAACTFFTGCVETCTAAFCMTDPQILQCTTGDSSLCGSFVYQDMDATAFFCTTDANDTYYPVYGYNTAGDVAEFYLYTPEGADQTVFTDAVTVTTVLTALTTPSPTNGTGPAPSHSSSSSSSSPPIGAIVGGSLGGIIAIGLLVALIIWLYKRKPRPPPGTVEGAQGMAILSSPGPVPAYYAGASANGGTYHPYNTQPASPVSGGMTDYHSSSGFPGPGPTEHLLAQGQFQDDGRTFSSGSATHVGNAVTDSPGYKKPGSGGLSPPTGVFRAASVMSAPMSEIQPENVDEIHAMGFHRG